MPVRRPPDVRVPEASQPATTKTRSRFEVLNEGAFSFRFSAPFFPGGDMDTHRRRVRNREPDRLLTAAEVAELTGLSVSTLSKLRMRRDAGPPFRKISTAVRYDAAAVQDWINRHPPRRSTADAPKMNAARELAR